jgi:hypothetical protein
MERFAVCRVTLPFGNELVDLALLPGFCEGDLARLAHRDSSF